MVSTKKCTFLCQLIFNNILYLHFDLLSHTLSFCDLHQIQLSFVIEIWPVALAVLLRLIIILTFNFSSLPSLGFLNVLKHSKLVLIT